MLSPREQDLLVIGYSIKDTNDSKDGNKYASYHLYIPSLSLLFIGLILAFKNNFLHEPSTNVISLKHVFTDAIVILFLSWLLKFSFSYSGAISYFKSKNKISPITQLPVTYKEIIYLHIKEISYRSLFVIPSITIFLLIHKYFSTNSKFVTFENIILISALYFSISYLQILTYRQRTNIISEIVGNTTYRKIRITLQIVLFFLLGISITKALSHDKPTNCYVISAIIIVTAIFIAWLHYKSYHDKQLDTLSTEPTLF